MTPGPVTDDIAYVLLDRVFGIPNFFVDGGGNGTCVEQDLPCFSSINKYATAEGPYPWPYHTALHQVMQFYSVGLLIVAVLIFIYFIIAIAAETAQTGTPFGRRFNKVWAPIRMVVALGLLVPTGSGLNAAQYFVLYAAKWGSGFATNGWNLFIANTVTGPSGQELANATSLVAQPQAPQVTNLLEFFTVVSACWASYDILDQTAIGGYLVKDTRAATPRLELDSGTTYDDALKFYDYHDILIRFGVCQVQDRNAPYAIQDCADNPGGNPVWVESEGYVHPTCGELVMQTTGALDPTANPGAYYIQYEYFRLVRDLWLGSSATSDATPTVEDCNLPAQPNSFTGIAPATSEIEQWGYCLTQRYRGDRAHQDAPVPSRLDVGRVLNGNIPPPGVPAVDSYQGRVERIIATGTVIEQTNGNWLYNSAALGWAGAGIWYNKIAQMNGSLIAAAQSVPYVRLYPEIMQQVQTARLKANKDVAGRDLSNPSLANSKPISFDSNAPQDAEHIASILWQAYDLFRDSYPKATNNLIIDFCVLCLASKVFTALWIPANQNVHPLAQLVGIGKSLVEAAIRNLAFAVGGYGVAAMVGENGLGLAAGIASGF